MGGEVDFNEVWLDEVRVPAFNLVGYVHDGWRVAGATLAGERQMVAGSGSGGVDRIGGSGADRLLATYRELGIDHPVTRDHLLRLHAEEHIRQSTNARVRATVKAGGTPGPAASIGKVHQGRLNQQLQLAACELSGMEAIAWEGDWLDDMPYATKGMIRSRANTIEGGTTEVNKNVLGEQVLGLPREPDPYHGVAWKETPR
jgi:alkylation response protein AidB-like acyl-CoA dehydrogenase